MPGPTLLAPISPVDRIAIAGTPADGSVRTITAAEFRDTVSTGKVVVEFFSYGCGFCNAARGAVHDAAARLTGDTAIVALSVDDPLAKAIGIRHGLSYYPTFAVFENGLHVGTFAREGREVPTADFIVTRARNAYDNAPQSHGFGPAAY